MGVEIQNTTNKQQLAGKMQITTKIQRTTEVSKRSYNNYCGKVQILTDLLQSYSPFTLDVKSKVTAANITKILQNTQNTQEYSKCSNFKIILRSLGATPVYSDKLHQID